MTYAEIDLFGVHVAPIAPMIVGAWVLQIPLRRLADHLGLLRFVWHPALFLFAVYLVVLSAIVLLVGRIGT
jgi:hypothetical protein